MVIEPIVKDLLEAGVHFGHQTHRWNPKMRRYIYGQKNGIYILDLEKTAESLQVAREYLRRIASEGGPILFVGTKRQAQPIVAQEAKRLRQRRRHISQPAGFRKRMCFRRDHQHAMSADALLHDLRLSERTAPKPEARSLKPDA